MTHAQLHAIDQQLLLHRCYYKIGDGSFHNSSQRLDPAEVIELIPSLTLDDLAAYKAIKDEAWQREIAQYACR